MQYAFSAIPGGHRLNYLMQRHVTRSYPIADVYIEEHREIIRKHLANYDRQFGGIPKNVFEFGSGWHLADPILLGLSGCENVIASDVRPLVSRFLVDDMLVRLGAQSLEKAHVRYIAPMDARNTGLADKSIDLIVSATVLEHIPLSVIRGIMRECRRILRGACSFYIDYKDHWSYFDPSISHLNFLRYSPAKWALYNPELHHQNRLRHSDYVNVFAETGLTISSVELERKPIPQVSTFQPYSEDDLEITGAWFTLT
jgi:hypothetical protein